MGKAYVKQKARLERRRQTAPVKDGYRKPGSMNRKKR